MTNIESALTQARDERQTLLVRLDLLEDFIRAGEKYFDALSLQYRDVQSVHGVPATVQIHPPGGSRPPPPTDGPLAPIILKHLEASSSGPLSVFQLLQKIGGKRMPLRRALKVMVRDGRVRVIGTGKGQSYGLASTVPPTSRPSAAGAGPACTRCDCLFKDHDPETGKCFGKKGKCVCTQFYA